jgi:hypothetical protein
MMETYIAARNLRFVKETDPLVHQMVFTTGGEFKLAEGII